MPELQLTLNDDERKYLVTALEKALADTRVEEHRTRTPTYREHIVSQENVIVALLQKLGKGPG
jgi:hypothetical protein